MQTLAAHFNHSSSGKTSDSSVLHEKKFKAKFSNGRGKSLKGWADRSVLFLDLILLFRGQAPGSSPQRRYGRFSSVLKLWADSCLEIFLGKG